MLAPVPKRPMQRQLSAPPGAVRIIAGRWRGRKLPVPALPGLRPTPDRVRETLFNWLMPVIEGSRCLDLFAGSGALGFEAASRGAADVRLIEREPAALSALRANVERLAADNVRIDAGDALSLLRQPPPARYDIVFVDPPYDAGLAQPAIAALIEHGWLAPGGFVYVEWSQDQPPPLDGEPWRRSRAGRVEYALYRPEVAS